MMMMMMILVCGFRDESTPKHTARKRRYWPGPRKYSTMGQPVRLDSTLTGLHDE